MAIWWANFFRSEQDGYLFPLFGSAHILTLIIWLAGIILLFLLRRKIASSTWGRRLPQILAVILLIDQIVLYSWQFSSGFFSLEESLPLFHCRIATPLIIIAFLLKQKWAAKLALYWAFLGSLMAMAIADLYQFSPWHYTNFQFFIVHITLGWLVSYFIFVRSYSFPVKDLYFILIATNLFNFFLMLVNFLLQKQGISANYGYLVEPPPAVIFLLDLMPPLVYKIAIFLSYSLAVFLIWLVGRYLLAPLSRGRKKKDLPEDEEKYSLV